MVQFAHPSLHAYQQGGLLRALTRILPSLTKRHSPHSESSNLKCQPINVVLLPSDFTKLSPWDVGQPSCQVSGSQGLQLWTYHCGPLKASAPVQQRSIPSPHPITGQCLPPPPLVRCLCLVISAVRTLMVSLLAVPESTRGFETRKKVSGWKMFP